MTYEMAPNISYKTACAPSKDSDQPVDLCSLIHLQGTLWVAKDPKHLQVDSKDSDQTVQMHRLI